MNCHRQRNISTDHGIRKPRSSRVGNKASSVVVQRNPCSSFRIGTWYIITAPKLGRIEEKNKWNVQILIYWVLCTLSNTIVASAAAGNVLCSSAKCRNDRTNNKIIHRRQTVNSFERERAQYHKYIMHRNGLEKQFHARVRQGRYGEKQAAKNMITMVIQSTALIDAICEK